MTTVDLPSARSPAAVGTLAPALRQLYFARSGFAAVWAALLFANKSHLGADPAVAGASGVPASLRVWGAWAIVSGAGQLIVGASASNPKLATVGGYAILGGTFFLVSAQRLGRAPRAD
ncbi:MULTISPECIES: hypothetical protein [unclassified Streptomyces]|uniref:hypothetical protein n=1 Tax=unclassified Streptomyces TaxID=2593676 RepID=UPI000B8A14D8|nr:MULTISPECIES: hypothetical protein [unclassified Streptomyces]MYS24208.1 hypothetical protein [Streptomyces sp. SID4948]